MPKRSWDAKLPDQIALSEGEVVIPETSSPVSISANITNGGNLYMTMQERVKPTATFQPEAASLSTGSMNFSLHPLRNKYKDFQFE